jgi:hypothetical protein
MYNFWPFLIQSCIPHFSSFSLQKEVRTKLNFIATALFDLIACNSYSYLQKNLGRCYISWKFSKIGGINICLKRKSLK